MAVNGKQEEWRPIPNFSRYEVSSFGRIRRAVKMRTRSKHSLLSPHADPDGYFRVTVYNDSGKQESRGVHQLVARAFLASPDDPNAWVLHKDDNNQHNVPENLKWGDLQENIKDAIKHDLLGLPFGEDNPNSKVDWAAVRDMRARYVPKVVTCKMLGAEYGVTESLVWLIVTNQHWVE